MHGHESGPAKVLYILATGRSGSTILGNVLGEMEGFFHAGELRTLWGQGLLQSRWCGCGVPVVNCSFWSEVLEVGFESVDAVKIYGWQRKEVRQRHALKFLRTPAGAHGSFELNSYIDAESRLYKAIAKVGGARVIVDSSKRQSDAALLRLMPDIDPYWLHLVRDPRAVAYSWQRQKASPGAAGGSRTEMLRVGPVTSTRRWLVSSAFGEAVRMRVGDRYLPVLYEDFMRNPEPTLGAIAQFICEPEVSLPFVTGSTVHLSTNHTAGGNPDRLNAGHVELRMDDEWIESQPRSHRLAVTGMTLPLLRRYGYPLTGKRRSSTNGGSCENGCGQ
jgi:hypothetical protein